ncbi:hypothetical protein [Acinetobacter rudis]|nr:hypothetical protein [Acinetobacter rudis]
MNTSTYVSDPNQWVDPMENGPYFSSGMTAWGIGEQSKVND